MPMSHLPPSYRAHLTLMLCGTVAAAGLVSCLVIGWHAHFAGIERRHELERLSKVAEKSYADIAAHRVAEMRGNALLGGHDAAAPSSAETTQKEPQRVTLTDVASQEDAGQFPEPVPIPGEVAPERMAQAMETLQKYFEAASWEGKLPYVANPDWVKPSMMEYYRTHTTPEEEPSRPPNIGHFKLNNAEVLLFSYPNERIAGVVDLAMVAPLDGGKFLVDWESFAGAGDLPWQEFKKQRATSPKRFRLYARKDDYYNYEFTDQAKLLSVHLSSPDGLNFIFGYCERDSAVGRTLAGLLERGGNRLPLTLRLAFPENAQSDHCVKIVGVVANRWLVVK